MARYLKSLFYIYYLSHRLNKKKKKSTILLYKVCHTPVKDFHLVREMQESETNLFPRKKTMRKYQNYQGNMLQKTYFCYFSYSTKARGHAKHARHFGTLARKHARHVGT